MRPKTNHRRNAGAVVWSEAEGHAVFEDSDRGTLPGGRPPEINLPNLANRRLREPAARAQIAQRGLAFARKTRRRNGPPGAAAPLNPRTGPCCVFSRGGPSA